MNPNPLSTIYLYLTRACNLNCRHCWINSEFTGIKEDNKAGVDFASLKKTLTEAKKIGLKSVKLTGGEPFLYPSILELMKWLKNRSITITIETNGTLIGEKEVEIMKECGVSHIAVALDGSIDKIHENLRGVRGSFKKTIEGIRKISASGLNLQIVFSLYRGNRDDLKKAVIFAKGLGAKSFKINPVNQVGRGGIMQENNKLLSFEEVLGLRGEVIQLRKRLRFNILLDIPPALWPAGEIKRNTGRCRIKNILGILADGSVSVCGIGATVKKLVFGNISKDSITDIWAENEILKQIREELPEKLKGICGKCIFRNYCLGKCRMQAYTDENSFLSSFDLCRKAYEKGFFPGSRIYEARAKKPEKNSDFILKREESGGILFNFETGDFEALNETGCFIWEQLGRGKSIDDIINSVVEKYRVEKKQAGKEIKSYIEDLKKAGTIR